MAQHGHLREYDEDWDRSEDVDRWRGEDHERGFMFGRDDRSREQERFAEDFRGGGWERAPRNYSGSQDDYYLSWRAKQMDALDRDYAEYRRERERQFHEEFDAWRRRRTQGNPEPLQTGMTQTGLSSDPTGELQLTADEAVEPASAPDPVATATLGTSSSRGRR